MWCFVVVFLVCHLLCNTNRRSSEIKGNAVQGHFIYHNRIALSAVKGGVLYHNRIVLTAVPGHFLYHNRIALSAVKGIFSSTTELRYLQFGAFSLPQQNCAFCSSGHFLYHNRIVLSSVQGIFSSTTELHYFNLLMGRTALHSHLFYKYKCLQEW